jgi:hypothetical protein
MTIIEIEHNDGSVESSLPSSPEPSPIAPRTLLNRADGAVFKKDTSTLMTKQFTAQQIEQQKQKTMQAKNVAQSMLSKYGIDLNEPNPMDHVVTEIVESNQNSLQKARLDKNMTRLIARSYWFAHRYGCATLEHLTDLIIIISVSEGGKGRQELVQTAEAVSRYQIEKNKENSMKL